MKHIIHPNLLNRAVEVALVGAGGNGCQMLTGLARLDRALRAVGHPGGLNVTLWDPDKVSEANVGRQLFSPADVGLYKATVLVHRVNMFYGLDWEAQPKRWTTADNSAVLITCVDTAKTRREIHFELNKHDYRAPSYWLDLGNRQQDGQIVLGEPAERATWTQSNKDVFKEARPLRLPTVIDMFPDLLDETIPEDNRPSCSLAEALESQDLFINQAVVTWALNLLWKLFREGGLDHHGYYVNLASGRVNPIPVPEAKPARKRERVRVAA